MKKILISTLAACCMISLAGAAAAANVADIPLTVTGDFRLRDVFYNDRIGGTKVDDSYFQFRARINLEAQINEDTTLFTRLGLRNSFGQSDSSDDSSYQQIDQYGIRTTLGDWKMSLGRQGVNLGQGLVISTGNDVEYDNKFDGLIATTKAGAADVKVIAGKTNITKIMKTYWPADDDTRSATWFGAEISGKISENVTAGLAAANWKPESDSSKNTWALNTVAKIAPNLSLNAEYARSNADDDNAAYLVGATYAKKKDSYTVQYQKVENNAINNMNSAYSYSGFPWVGNNMDKGDSYWKGWLYVYNHQMTPSTALHVYYIDTQADGRSGRDQEGAIGLVWAF